MSDNHVPSTQQSALTHPTQDVMARITDAVFAVDQEWRFTYLNPAATVYFSMPEASLIGRNLWNTFPDFVDSDFYHQCHHAMAEQQPAEFSADDPVRASRLRTRVYPSPDGLTIMQALLPGEAAPNVSDQRYRHLVEHCPFGILQTRPDGTILSANPSACRLLGMSELEICMAGRSGIVDTSDPRLAEWLRVRDEKGVALGRELRFIRKDGTRFEVEISSVVFLDADGHRTTSMILNDISQRKQIEEALRESEQRATALLNANTEAIMLIDCDDMILAVNSTMAQRLGHTICDLLGTDAYSLIPPDLAASRRAHNEEVIRTGRPLHYEDERAGMIFDNCVYPVLDAEGTVTGLAIFGQDITERKRAEELLQQSERRFRALIEKSAESLVVVDANGTVIYDTPTEREMLGYSPDIITGTNVLDLLSPEDRPRVNEALQHLVSHPGAAQRMELPARASDGSWRVLEVDVTNLLHDPAVGGIVLNARDITERQQMEKALRESEAKFRMLANTAPVAIGIVQHGRIRYANPAVSTITGFTPDELLEMPFTDIIHPDNHQLVFERVQRRLQAEEVPDRYELECLTKTGETVWLDFSVTATTYDGEPAILATAFDTTARKQAEEALRNSERTVTALLNACTEPIMFMDLEGTTLAANPAMAEKLGVTIDKILGKNIFSFMPPAVARLRQAQLAEIQRTGKPIRFEGERAGRIIDTNNFPVLDADGHVTGVAIYSIDVTERKQSEQAVARERAFLDAAIDMLPLPLAFFNRDLCTARANLAAQALLRRCNAASNDMLQILDQQTYTLSPIDRRPTFRALQGEVVTQEEYLLTVTDNHHLPIMISAAPISVDGEIVAAVTLIEDISSLKEADRAKDEFLAVLSHELQTPLTAILGWSDLALDNGTPLFLRQALEVVLRNARRQQVLIADMLDMSRLIHRKLELSLTITDLKQQAQQAVENLRHQADERRIHLTLRAATVPLPIHADPMRFQQCLGNLLQNSLKFTPAGGNISVTTRRKEQTAVITVRDTGQGMSPETIQTIFSPFLQIDPDEQNGGLGLGLAITRGIIELHGGQICATSPGKGRGSTFTITLPLASAATA